MPAQKSEGDMDRRDFLVATAVAGIGAAHADSAQAPTAPANTNSPELSLDDIASGMKSGTQSSQQLTQMYLDRIARLDRRGPMLGAVIQTNPRALESAAQLDAE
jgi:amidase